ncbi:F-box protein [Phytophthora cinnamomi]|uniref:F-box protein n=1 Tax=Phytophthora cinnamomi TaxID=4785 RepID=UPI00355A066E|nr:F-box protein [Phytophthora cinnamomi]
MAAVEKRRLVLLAPVYADVRSSTPVELRRTANGQLRSLALLTERQLLAVHGEYAITIIEHKPVATLELSVKVRHHARIVGKSLTRFEFALSHLQGDALAIARRSETSRLEARKSDLLAATCSSCHVVGCRLHRWQADDTLGPKAKLHLPDVFQSLMVHMETEQGEIRDDVVDRPDFSGIKVNLTDLPRSALHLVVYFMEASELAALSGVCSVFRHLAYAVVPGLNLVLYEHQRKGLKWMLYRETPSLIKSGGGRGYDDERFVRRNVL